MVATQQQRTKPWWDDGNQWLDPTAATGAMQSLPTFGAPKQDTGYVGPQAPSDWGVWGTPGSSQSQQAQPSTTSPTAPTAASQAGAQAGQQALAATQGQAQAQPTAPAANPSAASANFGYDYSDAAPGYNAWALSNGGTNDGGWYNAGADTQHWDSGRGNGSTSNTRDTIMRWTLDDIRNYVDPTTGQKVYAANPGSAPTDVVNQLFLSNVARMHRDFDANKLNWANSGFQNFDRVLQKPASTPAPGAPGGPPLLGAPPVPNNPATGPGTSPPIPPPPTGGQPTPQAQGAPPPPTAPGASGGIGPTSAQFLLDNPDQMYRQMLTQQGKTYAPHGMFTQFRSGLLGQALSALAQLETSGGTQNLDNLGGIINNFGNSLGSGHFYTDARNQAGSLLNGIDLSSMDPDQVDKLVKMAQGLETMGQSPMAQNAAQNRYSDYLGNYQANLVPNDMYEPQNYGDAIKQSPFWQSVAWLNQAR